MVTAPSFSRAPCSSPTLRSGVISSEANRPASSRIASTRSAERSPKRPPASALSRPATFFSVKPISSTGARYMRLFLLRCGRPPLLVAFYVSVKRDFACRPYPQPVLAGDAGQKRQVSLHRNADRPTGRTALSCTMAFSRTGRPTGPTAGFCARRNARSRTSASARKKARCPASRPRILSSIGSSDKRPDPKLDEDSALDSAEEAARSTLLPLHGTPADVAAAEAARPIDTVHRRVGAIPRFR